MQKRGQVTIFLVIGIIMLFLTAIIFFIANSITKNSLEKESNSLFAQAIKPQINFFVEKCLEKTAADSTYNIGLQGGSFTHDSQNSLITDQDKISFFIMKDKKLLTKQTIAEQISLDIETNLNVCLNDFSTFEQYNITITTEEPKVETIIAPNKIKFNLNYPLKIKNPNDETIAMEDFSTEINLRLGYIIEILDDIITKNQQPIWNPALFSSYEPFITIYPYDYETTLISIYDDKITYDENPFVFITAIREDTYNSPPKIENMHDFVLTKNIPFEYEITATDPENDAFIFSTDSLEFPINEEGLFNLTPQKTGTFYINVQVKDVKNAETQEKIRFVVEDE